MSFVNSVDPSRIQSVFDDRIHDGRILIDSRIPIDNRIFVDALVETVDGVDVGFQRVIYIRPFGEFVGVQIDGGENVIVMEKSLARHQMRKHVRAPFR